jgi:hypothetical protein
MVNYTEYVETMAKDGLNKVFFNSGPNHAAVVMSRIFKYSRETIRIYCGGFDGTVSNDEEYLLYLEQFLENGGLLRILVEQDMSKGPSEVYKILKKHKDQVVISQSSIKVINAVTNKPIHFTIGDNKMLRIELGITDYTAQVNFGDTEEASHMTEIFEKVLAQSRHLELAST